MIITIDGPAGAGKSTVAKLLARELGFDYLDTGATFRAVALACLRSGVDFQDEASLAKVMANLSLKMPAGKVVLDGEDVSTLIRTPEVTAASSAVAVSAVVRRHLAQLQRSIADGRDVICEGRDQGTVVFPNAGCKFFLVADPEERARRRQRELEAKGQAVVFQDILRDQTARDERDAARDLAPMVPAEDAIRIDSTGRTLDEVVALMLREVQRCRGGSTSSGTTSSSP